MEEIQKTDIKVDGSWKRTHKKMYEDSTNRNIPLMKSGKGGQPQKRLLLEQRD